MPIYMDRHEMEGATAKAVADAHEKDLKLQDQFGVKLLTYWFDESRGSAFCLVDAHPPGLWQSRHPFRDDPYR